MRTVFGTDGIRGIVGQSPFTPPEIAHIGYGLGSYLRTLTPYPQVVVGWDTRASGPEIFRALCHGLAGIGIKALGIVPTPAVSFMTRHTSATAGIMISASHNPPPYNGLKIFNAQGEKLSIEEEATISQWLAQVTVPTDGPQASIEDMSIDPYIDSFSDINLGGMKIVLDCAHGAFTTAAPRLITACGGTLVKAIGVQPNGHNINEGCGSLAVEGLQAAVKETRADLGISLDGDGDRTILVDDQGQVIDGDQILASLSQFFSPCAGVVGTVMTNGGLEHFLARHHIPFIRTAVGDRFIFQVLKERGWTLGGEECGHIVLADYLPTGDGLRAAVLVAHLLYHKGLRASQLFPLFTPFHTVVRNIPARSPKVLDRPEVKQWLAQAQKGLKGRLVVRPSGTEPVIRILVEGQEPASLVQLAEDIVSYLMDLQEAHL